ncbi:RNA-directed DNA polymerase, eukaryota [Artemisia annua]|uniref:RNA-directed DNA polymerase, eukaryota n=1 Tax=Artemisia annua TaxID=35608 RepID=A0A2U1MSD0_ARTAN|nr:RNA-directed DNA polymerase, eukaryota [Artemisia annua]
MDDIIHITLQSLGALRCICDFSGNKAPQAVIDKLEGMRLNFLWGGSRNKHKIHWVKKEVVLNSKVKGGLGLVPLEILNKSLMIKWILRYKVEYRSLWKNVVFAIHEKNRRLCFLPLVKSHSRTWKEIARMNSSLEAAGIRLRLLIQKVGLDWKWGGDGSGRFSVKSARYLIEGACWE